MFLPPRYYDKRSQSFISITRPGRARESAGRDVSTGGHTPTRAHHFAVDSPFFDIFKEACLARWVHFLRLPVSRNTLFFVHYSYS